MAAAAVAAAAAAVVAAAAAAAAAAVAAAAAAVAAAAAAAAAVAAAAAAAAAAAVAAAAAAAVAAVAAAAAAAAVAAVAAAVAAAAAAAVAAVAAVAVAVVAVAAAAAAVVAVAARHRIEARHEGVGARGNRQRERRRAVGQVEHRRGMQVDGGGAEWHLRQDVHRVGDDVAVRQHHAFGRRGRPAGVEDPVKIVARRFGTRHRRGRFDGGIQRSRIGRHGARPRPPRSIAPW